MANKDDKPKIKLITDPAEIQRLKDMEGAHERALEQAAKDARGARLMSKIAAKAASGQTFNIVWHKIEEIHEDSSALLRGHICESRDIKGKHFGLSVEVDYRKLYELNPARAAELADTKSTTLEFNQHRASIFEAGSFNSYEAAKNHMRQLDTYLMHVLAETGAEGTRLELHENEFVLRDDKQVPANYKYSDALRTARLVEAFRAHVIDAPGVPFRQAVGTILIALTSELDLPFERKEKKELSKMNVRCVFEREVGEFTFIDNGANRPATMKHEIPTGDRKIKKLKFEGGLTNEALQQKFIDWLAAAARERETISQSDFENLYGEIKAVKGVPLRSSKLGLFSPFPEGSNGGQNFTLN